MIAAGVSASPAVAETWLVTLARELAARHAAHTVILYGSRARGAARPESDVDLLVVCDATPAAQRDARRVTTPDGVEVDVDAWVYARAALDPETDAPLLRIRGGVALVDDAGFGAELIARCDAVHARGPAPMPADEVEANRVWLARQLARIATDDPARRVAAGFRRAELVTELLPWIFKARRWWYPGPEPAIARLQTEAPDVLAAYATLADPAMPTATFVAVARALGADLARFP